MIRRSGRFHLLIGLMLLLGLVTMPAADVAAQAIEQGTITVTKTWVDGHEPAEPVEDCFMVTADPDGNDILGETCTTESTVVFGPEDPALQTGVTYYVWEEAGSGREVTGNNPLAVVILATTGEATASFENRQQGASVKVHQFACPAGFESDDFDDYLAACQGEPRRGVEMSASAQGGYFVEGATDNDGIVVFPGIMVPGEVLLAETMPTGDFADFVVACERTDTGADILTSKRANGRAAVAFDLQGELVDAQIDIRCNWFNIPAAEVPELTFTIDPTSGSDGESVDFAGEGYTPGGTVTVVMTGDGLIVAEATADDEGAIAGTFEAPDRASLTGESTNEIPVWAIDDMTGRESPRVTFTYDQPEPSPTATSAPPSPTATATTAPSTATATATASATATAVATITPTTTATVVPPTLTPVAGRNIQIQPGACVDLTAIPVSPIYPLDAPSVPATTPQGALEASVSEVSYTVIDISLADLLASPHAINGFVDEAGNEFRLLCGEIGGPVRADGSIAVGLRELDDSGLTGIAYLSPNPANAGQTQVSLFIAMGLAEEDPSLIPATSDAPFITAIVDEGPIAPEFQAGYEVNIYASGRVDINVRPPGSSGALAEDQRTAEEEVRTVTLSNDALRDLLTNLHEIGFFRLTQADDIDPRDQLVGGPTSLLSVTLVDGVWDVSANGLSPEEASVLEETQQIVADAVGGVEVPEGQ